MAVQRRKVRDELDAWGLLDDWEASGLELGEFCRRQGVDGRSLNCWRRNLGGHASPTGAASLRLVQVVGAKALHTAVYRLEVGDTVVQVDDDFRDETLARLLRVVMAC